MQTWGFQEEFGCPVVPIPKPFKRTPSNRLLRLDPAAMYAAMPTCSRITAAVKNFHFRGIRACTCKNFSVMQQLVQPSSTLHAASAASVCPGLCHMHVTLRSGANHIHERMERDLHACMRAHQPGGDAGALLPQQALRRGRRSAGAGWAALLRRLLHGLHRRAALLRLRTPRIPGAGP